MSGIVISHNLQAMFSNRELGIVSNRKKKSSEKLTSGYKINRAADDAAGLSISEKMRRQIRGLSQASENCQDGVSFNQIGDGAMEEIHAMLHRMEELSVKSSNGTLSENDRQDVQNEIDEICTEIDRVTSTTVFNEMPVFGQERTKLIYDTNDPNTQRVIGSESYWVEGNKYGIAEVLGNDNIYSGTKLQHPLSFTGSDWRSTGRAIYNPGRSDFSNIQNKIKSLTGEDLSSYYQDSPGNYSRGIMDANHNGISYKVTLSYSDMKDAGGNNIISGVTLEKGTITNSIIDPSSYQTMASWSIKSDTTSAIGQYGGTYSSAWLDFSGLPTEYTVDSLYGQGFNSTCASCSCHYSILFTDNSLGAEYEVSGKSGTNGNVVLKVNISDCSSGSDIVQKLMKATNSDSFSNHYQQ